MSADLLVLMNRIARSMQSVVADLEVTPQIAEPVWLGDEDSEPDNPAIASRTDGWVNALGFDLYYRGVWWGSFERGAIGPERERVLDVALALMSQVQDIVALATTEPWPMIVAANGKNMALANASLEGDKLHMWYGDRDAPTLKLPTVDLT